MLRCLQWISICSVVVCVGCGQQPTPAPSQTTNAAKGSPAVPQKNEEPKTAPVTTEESSPKAPANAPAKTDQPAVASAPKKPAGPTQVMMNLNPVTADIVMAYILHPKRVLESSLLKSLQEAEAFAESDLQAGLDRFSQQTGISLSEIEEISLLYDQQLIATAAKQFGFGGGPPQRQMAGGPVNQMKMVGLGFHNYHDVYANFPASDGSGDGVNRQGFSWRVQMAPFVDAAPIYNQINFEEDWDSDANSKLHAQMPQVFHTNGVEEAGQTAFHVITGEGTLFDGEQGKRIASITDGTSNTIMAIIAGADTTMNWMQPGGLEFDPNDPKACLGTIEAAGMVTLLADGSVITLSKDIDPVAFGKLVTPDDGMPVNPHDYVVGANPNVAVIAPGDAANTSQAPFGLIGSTPETSPLIVVKLSTNIDRQKMLAQLPGQNEAKKEADHEYFTAGGWGMAFPTEQTGVFGNELAVQRWLAATKQESQGLLAEHFRAADQPFDTLFVVDLTSQKDLMVSLTSANPMLGILNNLKSISLHANSASQPGKDLLALRGTTVTPESAQGMAGIINSMALGTMKQQLTQADQSGVIPNEQRELFDLLRPILEALEMKAEGNQLSLVVPAPENMHDITQAMAIQFRQAKASAEQAQKRNGLRQLGLAFHNYESSYQRFPKAGGPAVENDQIKDGLSWRVQLLPFVDQTALYNQFHLDEPWDSEHNKTLIPLMPAIFQVEGVDEPGKTSVHVLVGEGAPFADNKAPRIADFTDGTSNTLLAVVAGPDKADIWTKPGGLEYDVTDPVSALGKIGETFLVLFADGSVRNLPREIDPDTLLHLFQHRDGNVVDIPLP